MTGARTKPYTTRARVALAIARSIAAARGDAEVTGIHIALGLLREAENAAVAALVHGGVDLRTLRRDLELALGPRPGGMPPDQVVVPLTRGEQDLVHQARAESDRRVDEHLGPEHLLLALLTKGASPTAQILARQAFNHAAALEHLEAVLHPHRGSSEPPAAPPTG